MNIRKAAGNQVVKSRVNLPPLGGCNFFEPKFEKWEDRYDSCNAPFANLFGQVLTREANMRQSAIARESQIRAERSELVLCLQNFYCFGCVKAAASNLSHICLEGY